MGDLKVRNLPDDVILRLNYLAEKKGVSREEYIRTYLQTLAVTGELKSMEDKYQTMISKIVGIMQNTNIQLEMMNERLEKMEGLFSMEKTDHDEMDGWEDSSWKR